MKIAGLMAGNKLTSAGNAPNKSSKKDALTARLFLKRLLIFIVLLIFAWGGISAVIGTYKWLQWKANDHLLT